MIHEYKVRHRSIFPGGSGITASLDLIVVKSPLKLEDFAQSIFSLGIWSRGCRMLIAPGTIVSVHEDGMPGESPVDRDNPESRCQRHKINEQGEYRCAGKVAFIVHYPKYERAFWVCASCADHVVDNEGGTRI